MLALLDLATGNESGVTGVVVKFLGCDEKKVSKTSQSTQGNAYKHTVHGGSSGLRDTESNNTG